MRYNEVPAARRPKKPEIVRQPEYTGKKYFRVQYAGQTVDVRCADETAALFFAAKHWGFKWTRPEYHQTAKVTMLRMDPELVIG
jgi:hypothetical protein